MGEQLFTSFSFTRQSNISELFDAKHDQTLSKSGVGATAASARRLQDVVLRKRVKLLLILGSRFSGRTRALQLAGDTNTHPALLFCHRGEIKTPERDESEFQPCCETGRFGCSCATVSQLAGRKPKAANRAISTGPQLCGHSRPGFICFLNFNISMY